MEVWVQRDSGLMILSSTFRLIFGIGMLYAFWFMLFISATGGLYRMIGIAAFIGFMRLYVHLVTTLQIPLFLTIRDDGLTIHFRKSERNVCWRDIQGIEILRQFKHYKGVYPSGAIIRLKSPQGMQRRKFYRVDAVAAMEVLKAYKIHFGQLP